MALFPSCSALSSRSQSREKRVSKFLGIKYPGEIRMHCIQIPPPDQTAERLAAGVGGQSDQTVTTGPGDSDQLAVRRLLGDDRRRVGIEPAGDRRGAIHDRGADGGPFGD